MAPIFEVVFVCGFLAGMAAMNLLDMIRECYLDRRKKHEQNQPGNR